MIPRYSRHEMVSVWSDENKWKTVLDIELLVCEAQEKTGLVPKGTADVICDKAKIDIKRICEIERDVGHDVIAFLTCIAESVGEPARYLHFGLTSSDVIDTCFSVQLRNACLLLETDLSNLLKALRNRAFETRDMLCVGRTHGMHAEYMTFGMKFARMYAEFQRGLRRLSYIKEEEISICAISGAVGAYNTISPEVEEYVAKKLNLKNDVITSQVIARDRHAMLFSVLGVIAGSAENAATEIRHLHRTEVGEVEEPFMKLQKGSSAMPHKKNPILSENITGLARLVRSYVAPSMENIALWHERDISHSSVERVIAPDAFIALDFALNRLTHVINNMTINPERIAGNLTSSKDKMYSQKLLLSLVESGITREEAYAIVQRNAFDKRGFKQSVLCDGEILKVLGEDAVGKLFNELELPIYLDVIFSRVFAQNNGYVS